MRGVAFKTTYNDGGAKGGLVGYRGVCSEPTMYNNVIKRKVTWCSDKKCECSRFLRGKRKKPPTVKKGSEGPCYESTLLLNSPWAMGVGVGSTGSKKDEPFRISNAEVGDIAILTTMPPGGTEQADRIIYGLFRIGEIVDGTDGDGDFVKSDGTMDVLLPDDVARQALYWNYQDANKDGSRWWGAGLFRYMEGAPTVALIRDLLWKLCDEDAKDLIIKALSLSPEPMTVRPTGRGYGRGGGEGEAHRSLKLRVAKDPTLLGLPKGSVATVEYVYRQTGDRVDIKFDLPDGTAAVVEVETNNPEPGAHQAVKYRALLEVERDEKLGMGNVQAILVAHVIDDESKRLGSAYGIKTVKLGA